MVSPSQPPMTKTLGESEGEIAWSLANNDPLSFASGIMRVKSLQEAVFLYMLEVFCTECNELCKLVGGASLFRKLPVTDMANIKWEDFILELDSKAPNLLHALLTIVSPRDDKNSTKVGSAHFPGLCTAVALLLKERNREMCGIQSLVSTLMYSCHCEKQVSSPWCLGLHKPYIIINGLAHSHAH